MLLTTSGIAFNEDEGESKFKFFYWKDSPGEPDTTYKLKKCQFNNIWFTVINDENYESNADFKKRAKKFGLICKQIRYDSMMKTPNIYIPIDSSYLIDDIPQNEEILYSTMCFMKRRYASGSATVYEKWDGYVLITKSFVYLTRTDGTFFAYSLNDFSGFHKKSAKIRRVSWKMKLIVIRHENFESQDVFDLRSNNFGPFCAHLSRIIVELRTTMRYFARDKKALEKRISQIGFDNFFNDLEWYFHIDSNPTREYSVPKERNTKLKILDNMWDLMSEDIRRTKYEFFKSLKVKGFKEAFHLFTKNEIKAIKLHAKGVKQANKEDYEKALNFYEDSLKLNPYETEVQNSRIEALKALGKDTETD